MVDGPTSIWECQEVRTLDGVNDAQRGASFLCSLTGADQRRPLGCLTNLSSLKSKLVIGWPSLYQIDRDLVYNGPLPPSCQCSPPHPPLRGLDSREEFHSCSSSALGESFWRLCVDPWCTAEYTSLRAEGTTTAYSGTYASARSPGFSFLRPPFLLASSSRSRASFYEHWCVRSLSFSVLTDFLGEELASAYLATEDSPLGFCFSSSCRVSAVGLQLSASSPSTSASLAPSAEADLLLAAGPPCASLLSASSRSSGISKGPLMARPSRGDVSSDVSCALLTGAGKGVECFRWLLMFFFFVQVVCLLSQFWTDNSDRLVRGSSRIGRACLKDEVAWWYDGSWYDGRWLGFWWWYEAWQYVGSSFVVFLSVTSPPHWWRLLSTCSSHRPNARTSRQHTQIDDRRQVHRSRMQATCLGEERSA